MAGSPVRRARALRLRCVRNSISHRPAAESFANKASRGRGLATGRTGRTGGPAGGRSQQAPRGLCIGRVRVCVPDGARQILKSRKPPPHSGQAPRTHIHTHPPTSDAVYPQRFTRRGVWTEMVPVMMPVMMAVRAAMVDAF